MTAILVRLARPEDTAELGALQLRSWRSGYSARLPGGVLDALSENDLAAGWREAVNSPPSGRHRVLVAAEGARIVGFAALAPAVDPDLAEGAEGELVTLAVDPAVGRQGHGSRLLNAAMDFLRDDGFGAAVTWALASDETLRAFLQDTGWAPDGAWRDLETPSGETVRQVRLHTSLAAQD